MTKLATLAVLLVTSFVATNAANVDAENVATVIVDAPLYDTRIAADGGCDPAGCSGDLTRDGDIATEDSRWSCKPELDSLGSTCSITYSLSDSLYIEELNIAMSKGDERTRTIEIYVDGVILTTWTSSGTTLDFETVTLGATGSTIELRGVLEDSEWLSIMEVEIMVLPDGSAVAPSPAPAPAEGVESVDLSTVIVDAPLYDTRLGADGGCDPAGCSGDLTTDGDSETLDSRWSCKPELGSTGAICYITYALPDPKFIEEVNIAMSKGDERKRTVEIYVDDVIVTTWTSSGTTLDFETVTLGVTGTSIELRGVLEDSEWLSIMEVEIVVLVDGSTLSPTPAPAPTGDLEPVGLIPLPNVGSTLFEHERYQAKDNDMSTSWTCNNSTYSRGDCRLTYDLFWYRNIKEVKIALSNGADAAIDMKIGTAWYSDDPYEMFVTTSGTTTDFETYEFDVFTRQIVIVAYVTGDESISISEVEFIEEVRADEVPARSFETPYEIGDSSIDNVMTDGFEWWSQSDDALDEELVFELNYWASLTAVGLQFPVGETYLFELHFYTYADVGTYAPFETLTGLESEDTAGWQTFDLELDADQTVTGVHLVMKGTGSGASGFYLLDARFIGTHAANPTDNYYVGSAHIVEWYGQLYPDFVGKGTSDQEAIMGAICAVKKASFDGVDCVGEDPDATGTVTLTMGEYFISGNIFLKSGVLLNGDYSIDDHPNTTDFILEDDAAGNTDIDAIIVVDGVTDAVINEVWVEGLYDPDTSNDVAAVAGLGSTALAITNSQNIEYTDAWMGNMDGDVIVVRDSQMISIDAYHDEEYLPYRIASSRDIGLLVDTSENVYVRRHAIYDNGEAGIRVINSVNFTFDATIDEYGEGDGYVGSLDGQQPIEVIVESSTRVIFQDMSVSSEVFFNNNGFSNVDAGICVIQAEDPSVVTVEDDELVLVGSCYVKV